MNLGSRYNQHSFAHVPQANVPRSKFDRSYTAKDTGNFDELFPIFVEEVLPGDTFNVNVNTFIRLATQQVPIMDNMYMDFYAFFTPNRLVWDNWEKQMGSQTNPGDSTDYLTPQVTTNGVTSFAVGSMADKFGIPTGEVNMSVNALPFRMYNLIWNEWFRDQNLQDSITVNKHDGPDSPTLYNLQKAARKHDYFSSALPSPQKGAAVLLPIAGEAPVVGTGDETYMYTTNPAALNILNVYNDGSNNKVILGGSSVGGSATPLHFSEESASVTGTGLKTVLTGATATTITMFRQAIMMQSLLELDNRGGTRYVELIKAHFNVISPDFRLQRPEYLGGGTSRFMVHPVAQTSQTDTDSPQANLAAYTTLSQMGSKIGFAKSFVEHGWVMILARARGDVTYQQGLARQWSRNTRFDYYWPKFQELSDQAILNKEIYYDGSDLVGNEEVWGYIPRHDDYRFRFSEIRGQFRSTFAQSLDVWHLAEEYLTRPGLSPAWIQSNTPIERVLAVEDYPALLMDFWFDFKAARPMSTYAVPASLGRF